MISANDWVNPSSATKITAGTPAFSVDLPAGTSLADAVTKINVAATAAASGVVATAVSTGSGMRLQLAAKNSGAAGTFTVGGGLSFETLAAGADAKLTVGSGTYTFPVTSSSNTFTDLLAGSTFTVSKQGETATVTVASDPAAVTTAVQSLVTAANTVLSTIREYSNNAPGSTAVLRGDSSLRGLSSQVVEAVTYAVGTLGSAAGAGIQLSKDGQRIEFSADTFSAKLKADPGLAQNLVNGSGSVPGVAQRLLKVAQDASNSTTGTLATLAKGKDTEATDLQKRIDDWDLRLELRQQTLTRQFSAMESALGSLQNQSSWLSSQLGSLPSWSK
jgi:flagellar hook-associated protein 2